MVSPTGCGESNAERGREAEVVIVTVEEEMLGDLGTSKA